MLGGFRATAMAKTAGVSATELTPMLVSWLADPQLIARAGVDRPIWMLVLTKSRVAARDH